MTDTAMDGPHVHEPPNAEQKAVGDRERYFQRCTDEEQMIAFLEQKPPAEDFAATGAWCKELLSPGAVAAPRLVMLARCYEDAMTALAAVAGPLETLLKYYKWLSDTSGMKHPTDGSLLALAKAALADHATAIAASWEE